MEMLMQVLGLLTAIIALVAAIISLKTTQKNRARIEKHETKIETLKREVNRVALGLTIDAPRRDEIITGEVYNDMEGTFSGDIPNGYKLWVLAHDQYNYFLMHPPTQFIRTMGKWSQPNIRLVTPGNWELHVCLANDKASKWCQKRVDRNDWSGFSKLPKGMESIRYTIVNKQ